MHVVYVTQPNGAKLRKVFWNIGEAFSYCSELVRQGYTQQENGEGFSRWAIA